VAFDHDDIERRPKMEPTPMPTRPVAPRVSPRTFGEPLLASSGSGSSGVAVELLVVGAGSLPVVGGGVVVTGAGGSVARAGRAEEATAPKASVVRTRSRVRREALMANV
jgi:hypothetical protein